MIRSLELDNSFSRIASLPLNFNNMIRSLGLQFVPSVLTSNNWRERIAIRENELSQSMEWFTTRENGLSNSREQITNPWVRVTNPRERIAQFDITIYFCLLF